MSDYSTQAMGPKERSTCGNCNNCDFFDMECSYIEEDGTHRKVTMDTPACADWERRVLADEERYERLVQVAGEMLETIRGYVSENLRGSDPRLKDAICEPYVDYRRKLEGCGVSVDV